MSLNTEQQNFFNLVVSRKFEHVVLTGFAGTGKTHVIAAILRRLREMDIPFTVCAPTIAAAAVLHAKINDAKIGVKTVASVVGAFGFQTPTGETIFRKGNAGSVKSHGICFVDELSMVPEKHMKALKEAGLQIVGIGDKAQLGAVKAKNNTFFDTAKVYTLTEPMRNGGEIYRISNLNREEVYHPIKSEDNVTVWSSAEAQLEHFLDALQSAETPTDFTYLSYRNSEVDRIADLAHKRLYGETDFVVGQYLRLEENHPGCQAKGHPVIITQVIRQEVIDPDSPKPVAATVVEVRHPQTEANRTTLTVVPPKEQKQLEWRLEKRMKRINEEYELSNMEVVTQLRKEYDWLDASFNRVSSPFSITVHKAQGMSTPHVYVNNKELGNRRALLYVGFSRASKHLHTVMMPSKIKCVSWFSALQSARKAAKELGYSHDKIWRDFIYPANELGYLTSNDEGRQYVLQQILNTL